ncbi:hypothetical protein Asal01_00970 [Fodinibius salicampi]
MKPNTLEDFIFNYQSAPRPCIPMLLEILTYIVVDLCLEE